MELYQLYTTRPDSLYKEYCTDFVLTLEKINHVLTDETFLLHQQIYFDKGITAYRIEDPDERGNRALYIQYLDYFNEYEEIVYTLFKVKCFT